MHVFKPNHGGQGLKLRGRMEKRLPIIVGVRLANRVATETDGEERTYTDNISPGGARVFSQRSWQPGDVIRITALNEKPVWSRVIYCQRLGDDRFGLGVKFGSPPVMWSVLQRYGRP